MQIRLDSYLSKYAVCSRRKAKVLVENGNISVNGKIIKSIIKIDEENDFVEVDNKKIDTKKLKFRYIALNKPINILCTTSDDRGRRTVLDIIKIPEKIYPVGRLDYNSSGLILLTNDGDFALKVSHPRYELPKKYIVVTEELLTNRQLDQMRKGVRVYETKTLPCEIKKLESNKFEIILHQGIKRQIREMCKAVNLTVNSLERISIGNLKLGDLKAGEYRDLTDKEKSELL